MDLIGMTSDSPRVIGRPRGGAEPILPLAGEVRVRLLATYVPGRRRGLAVQDAAAGDPELT
jgi:hypothetical protein